MEKPINFSGEIDNLLTRYEEKPHDIDSSKAISKKTHELVNQFDFQNAEESKVKQIFGKLLIDMSKKTEFSPFMDLPTELQMMILCQNEPQKTELSREMQTIGYETWIKQLKTYFHQQDSEIFLETERLAGIDEKTPSKEKYQKLWFFLLKKLEAAMILNHVPILTENKLNSELRHLVLTHFADPVPFLPKLIQFLQDHDLSLLTAKSYIQLHTLIDEDFRMHFPCIDETGRQLDPMGLAIQESLAKTTRNLSELSAPLKKLRDYSTNDNSKREKYMKCFRVVLRNDFFHIPDAKTAGSIIKGEDPGIYFFRKGSLPYTISLTYSCKGTREPLHIRLKFHQCSIQFEIPFSTNPFITDSWEEIIERLRSSRSIDRPISRKKVEEKIPKSPSLGKETINNFKKILNLFERDDFINDDLKNLKILIHQSNPGDYLITRSKNQILILFKNADHRVIGNKVEIDKDSYLSYKNGKLNHMNEILALLMQCSDAYGLENGLTPVQTIESRNDYYSRLDKKMQQKFKQAPPGTYFITKCQSFSNSYTMYCKNSKDNFIKIRIRYSPYWNMFILKDQKYHCFKEALSACQRILENIFGFSAVPLNEVIPK